MKYMQQSKIFPYPPQLRWERALVNSSDVTRLQKGLLDIAEGGFSPKTIGSITASIVTVGSFRRAAFRTKGTFDPDIFAGYFIEDTNFSPLLPTTGSPQKIDFLNSLSLHRPNGSRVALFFHSIIEDEQRSAHALFAQEGLGERPFLAGAHLSVGTLSECPSEGQKREIADYLFSLVCDDLAFQPVTQRHFSPTGFATHQSPLIPMQEHETDADTAFSSAV